MNDAGAGGRSDEGAMGDEGQEPSADVEPMNDAETLHTSADSMHGEASGPAPSPSTVPVARCSMFLGT